MILTKNSCPEGKDDDVVLSIHFWVHKVTVEGQANHFDERYLLVNMAVKARKSVFERRGLWRKVKYLFKGNLWGESDKTLVENQ